MLAGAAEDGDRRIGTLLLSLHHPGCRMLAARVELARVLPRIRTDMCRGFPGKGLTNGDGDRI